MKYFWRETYIFGILRAAAAFFITRQKYQDISKYVEILVKNRNTSSKNNRPLCNNQNIAKHKRLSC